VTGDDQTTREATLWERMTYGPLMDLRPSRRSDVAAIVMRGNAPGNASELAVALRYAQRQLRFFGVAALISVMFGIGTLVELLVTGPMIGEVSGAALLALGASYFGPVAIKARRAKAMIQGKQLHSA
jgi:hypothetical protein